MLSGLLFIDLFTLLLILVITLVPSSIVRSMLGIPFLLFFPGYALLASLFSNNKEIGGLERLALSCVISIALVALTGFGLNFTTWGISLEPVLYSLTIFTILTSTVALIRGASWLGSANLTLKPSIKLSDWGGSTFHNSIYIVLLVSILGAIGILGYNLATLNTGEKFTEFYILGENGKAQDYPAVFIMENGQVTLIKYGNNPEYMNGGIGKVTLGIVNHERQKSNYSVRIKINGKLVNFYTRDTTVNEITDIVLLQGEKWEQEIGFTPSSSGDNQKVEFLFFRDGNDTPEDTLQILINVEESK